MANKRAVNRALDKIEKMVREIKAWKGEAPTLVRISYKEYLALVDAGLIENNKLKGRDLEVKPG